MNSLAQSPLSLIFFTTSTYRINVISGDAQFVLNEQASEIINLGKDITAIEWTKIFLTPPNFNESTQILFTINHQKVLLSFLKICEENDLEFIITMTNLTKSSQLAEQNIQLNDDQSKDLFIKSEKMKNILQMIYKVAQVNSTVLLLGESGVGKTFLARKIHAISDRAEKPFVSLNCGAIPENLIESELFGYEAGAFTGGAKAGKKGLFEAADKGTIFLDEIAELPYSVQSKLLDVLQEKRIRKVGGTDNHQIDVRIIAATNKNLEDLVAQKKFREDLFYRLNVVPLSIPPLRERTEEIPGLIHLFLQKFNKKYNRQITLSDTIVQQLASYQWPGNIRELENIIERMIVTNEFKPEVPFNSQETAGHDITVNGIIPLKEAKRIVEKELVTRAYEQFGSTYKAAKALKVDQSTIAKKMKEYKNEI